MCICVQLLFLHFLSATAVFGSACGWQHVYLLCHLARNSQGLWNVIQTEWLAVCGNTKLSRKHGGRNNWQFQSHCAQGLFQKSLLKRVSHSHMLLVINSECGNLQGHPWKENESFPVVGITNWCRHVCPLSSLISERSGEGRKTVNMLRIQDNLSWVSK